MLTLYLYALVISGLGLAGMLYWQWSQRDEAVATRRLAWLDRQLESAYHRFSEFFIAASHSLVVVSLLTGRRLAVAAKFIAIRFEHKFSRLINAVRGQGMITKKGSVSLFLTRLTEERQ